MRGSDTQIPIEQESCHKMEDVERVATNIERGAQIRGSTMCFGQANSSDLPAGDGIR